MAENQGVSAPPPAVLAAKPVPDGAGTLAKGEFARHIGVSPGRVSQYIAGGKLSGEAITENGRIVVEKAKAQLRLKLDVSQMAGNGLDTKLKAAPATETAPISSPLATLPLAPTDTVEEQIKLERLAEYRARNRKLAEEEAARAGRYVDAESVKLQLGRVAGQMMTIFEGALPELATAAAAHFKLPQRDVLHLLRTEFVAIRGRVASSLAKEAETLPVLVEQNEAEAEPE